MKNLIIFTGAGISVESGISTFRDSADGLWYNYNVDEVATAYGLKKNPKKVFEFHNMLRKKLNDIQPNAAHKALVNLEDKFNVTIVTQNVDDLHERAGSSNILHLHGELFKVRTYKKPEKFYDWRNDLNFGDEDAEGNKLRPHTVLFDEMPYNFDKSFEAIYNADILLIIGTSLEIGYTVRMLNAASSLAEVYYIDPNPSDGLTNSHLNIKYIKKKASEGVKEVVEKLMKD
jgi:NAD-dependent deacetylase